MSDQSKLIQEITQLLIILTSYEDDGDRSQEGFHRYYEHAGYAAEKIKKMGANALQGLLLNLNNSNPEIRKEVVSLLSNIKDDDSVPHHLLKQLENEDNPQIKKNIESLLERIEKHHQPEVEPETKAVILNQPEPEPEEKQGLFAKLKDMISKDDTPEQDKPAPAADYVRHCFVCNKKIKAKDTMIVKSGSSLRSSGKEIQVQGPVFCSHTCYKDFKQDPASWR